MGFDPDIYRPEDLIHAEYLPIPPVTIRPSLRTEFLVQQTYEDSLLHNYIEVLKSNNKVKKFKEKEGENPYSKEHIALTEWAIAVIFDNTGLPIPTSEQKLGSKPTKSISERLSGKTGRIRGNLMGKRVDYSARTVITSDPNISINSLGVPVKIAKNLTFPVIVNSNNINELNKYVKNGRYQYPGANYIKFKNGNMIDLKYRKNVNLQIGDEVHRHLISGDYVLFNRQPSLHKLSMMAHKIMVINDPKLSTFRLNVSATPPYNADFDGDEMNMFIPQNIQTSIELEKICNLKYQIISPRSSEPIISFVQDSVLGVYLLTQSDTKINWKDYMNLLGNCKNIDLGKIEKNKNYSGHQIYTKLIPDEINLNKDGCEINNGVLLKGIIKKNINKTIVSNIWYKYGADLTANYVFNVQRLISNWLLSKGFTAGMKDLILSNTDKQNIITEVEKKKLEISHLITEIENNPELIDADTFEETIKSNLASHKGVIEKMVMSKLDNSNNFYVMAKSGSKGKGINIMQMMGVLGQDILEFKRIQKTVNMRTLPHIFQNDDRATARGFIERSYLDGLTPQEFFFHNMASREGLIDTAIKTQDTGYISRKLMKGCEDIMVKYDSTIRMNNKIIQFVYGDNGVDQIKQTIQKVNLITSSDKEVKEKYCFNEKDVNKIENKFKIKDFKNINENYFINLKQLRDELRVIQTKFILNYITLTDEFPSPVNFSRLITDILNYQDINDKNEELSPIYILDKIKYILLPDTTILFNTLNDQNKIKDEINFKYLFKILLYEYLSPNIVINKYKLSKFKFDILVKQIIENYNDSIVEPGEMVGSLAAQHIGEPSTQMTLNTFHATGSGSVGMQGVPRLRELISITKSIKTPNMEIYLNEDNNNNYKFANLISSTINLTLLKDIVRNHQIIYEFNDNKYLLKDNVSNMFQIPITNNKIVSTELPFIIRLKLNKILLIKKSLSILDIKTSFVKFWQKNYLTIKNIKRQDKELISNIIACGIMGNNENSNEPIIHIRFDMKKYYHESIDYINNFTNIILEKFLIRGIDNISNVLDPIERQYIKYDEKTKEVVTSKEYILSTEGINLSEIRFIDGINLNRTICNNIIDIYKYFGIEAARSLLIKELTTVFTSSGNDVNYHHLSILVDLITNNGSLISIDRHGLIKLENDPLSKASFEKTVDVLLQSALYNKIDNLQSVSSRIICGRTIKGGTGSFDILIDNEMIENSELQSTINIDESEYKIKFELNEIQEFYNRAEIIDVFIPL